jgi:hypothetical protein
MAQLALGQNQAPTAISNVPTLTIPTNINLNPMRLALWALNWLVWIAGAIALGFLIYGGIMFVTSGGDAEKTTKARNTILYAVVGIIVVTISYAVIVWANSLAPTI